MPLEAITPLILVSALCAGVIVAFVVVLEKRGKK